MNAYVSVSGSERLEPVSPLSIRLVCGVDRIAVKFITHLTVTDSLKEFGQGLGSRLPKAAMPGTPGSDVSI